MGYMVMNQIGKNIRQIRREFGITQTELAKRMGIFPTVVSRIESCKFEPRISTVKKAADALGVDIFDLFREIT